MTEKASEIKAGMSNPAKILLAYMRCSGISDAKTLAADLDIPIRTIQRLKLECATCANDAIYGGPEAPNAPNTPDMAPSMTPDMAFSKVEPSRAHATKESLRDKSYLEVSNSPPTPSWQPREGEEDVGQNVFVNCKTIRHPNFTINVDGVRMTALNSGLSAEEIRTFCVGMALQWATEIDGGKEPSKVVPDRISNFLSASIARGKIRADVGEVQRTKAGQSAKMADADIFARLRAEEAAHAAY